MCWLTIKNNQLKPLTNEKYFSQVQLERQHQLVFSATIAAAPCAAACLAKSWLSTVYPFIHTNKLPSFTLRESASIDVISGFSLEQLENHANMIQVYATSFH